MRILINGVPIYDTPGRTPSTQHIEMGAADYWKNFDNGSIGDVISGKEFHHWVNHGGAPLSCTNDSSVLEQACAADKALQYLAAKHPLTHGLYSWDVSLSHEVLKYPNAIARDLPPLLWNAADAVGGVVLSNGHQLLLTLIGG